MTDAVVEGMVRERRRFGIEEECEDEWLVLTTLAMNALS